MPYFNFTAGKLKTYELLNKDMVIARFSIDATTDSVVDFQWGTSGVRPIGFSDVT